MSNYYSCLDREIVLLEKQMVLTENIIAEQKRLLSHGSGCPKVMRPTVEASYNYNVWLYEQHCSRLNALMDARKPKFTEKMLGRLMAWAHSDILKEDR